MGFGTASYVCRLLGTDKIVAIGPEGGETDELLNPSSDLFWFRDGT